MKKRNASSKVNWMSLENHSPRQIRNAFLGIFLALYLSGCATDPVIQTRVEIQRVPDALTVACPISSLEGNTYQAAIELALALKVDLVECNRRMEEIRKWGK